MTANMTPSGWMKFFCDAGIPVDVAGNYAVIFNGHRMQMDMLADLSMEILKEMGIIVMGDIIAILKHAKEIHAKVTREKALNLEPVDMRPEAAVRKTTPSQPSRSSSLAVERRVAPKEVKTAAKRTVIRLTQPAAAQPPDTAATVPMVKRRRVLPEEEGAYTIKMPAGTTPRTRRLLDHGISEQVTKRSVFQRLGEQKVTSTTDNGDSTKITLTSFGRSVMDSGTAAKNASVFDRLGPGNVSSTSGADDDDGIADTLDYQGTVKALPMKVVKRVVRKAEATSSGRCLAQDEVNRKTSVLTRLGPKMNTNSPLVKVVKQELKMKAQAKPGAISLSAATTTAPQTAGILAAGVKRTAMDIHSRLGQKTQTVVQRSRLLLQPKLRTVKKVIGSECGTTAVKVFKVTSDGTVVKRIVKRPLTVRRIQAME